MRRFEGRVAVVTGAAQGMGKAVALRLGEEGATVIAADINGAGAAATAKTIGGGALGLACDIGDEAAVVKLFDSVAAKFGKLDILVNVAAIVPFMKWDELTFTEWRRAHQLLDLACGTPTYPKPEGFPWPEPPFSHDYLDEKILHPYADGRDFINSLKLLGASEPAPGYRPLSTGAMRRLLAALSEGFDATYHVIYGEVRR